MKLAVRVSNSINSMTRSCLSQGSAACNKSRPSPVWKPAVLEWANNGNRPLGNITWKSILAPFPDVVEGIVEHLWMLCKAGTALDAVHCCAIIVAWLQHCLPVIFQTPACNGSYFQCSTSWVHWFLLDNLHWSYHCGTWAAQKLLSHAADLCLEQFLWHSVTTRDQVIPGPGFCVNVDQCNVIMQPASSCTYEVIGSRQIAVTGKDKKCVFTVVMAISDSGFVLPPQVIFQEKSPWLLPSNKSPHYQEAMDIGIKFEYSNTNTYWLTFELMYRWVTDILVPYFEQQKRAYNASEAQECILQLDVWSVHHSIAFWTWLNTNYDWITYLYVPGNCTGIAQPCDVGIQRPFKQTTWQA